MNVASTSRRHYTLNVLMDVNLTDVSINQQIKIKKKRHTAALHSFLWQTPAVWVTGHWSRVWKEISLPQKVSHKTAPRTWRRIPVTKKYLHIYIYIYIERERERVCSFSTRLFIKIAFRLEWKPQATKTSYLHTHTTHTHTHTHTHIYIYIERERERERESLQFLNEIIYSDSFQAGMEATRHKPQSLHKLESARTDVTFRALRHQD